MHLIFIDFDIYVLCAALLALAVVVVRDYFVACKFLESVEAKAIEGDELRGRFNPKLLMWRKPAVVLWYLFRYSGTSLHFRASLATLLLCLVRYFESESCEVTILVLILNRSD
jgi:hypothetical protein